MAALTADRNTLARGKPGPIHHVDATASTQYFKGGIVYVQQSTGKLVKGAITLAGVVAAGICLDNVLTGASPTEKIRVRAGTFKFVNGETIANATDRGKLAFQGDDQTVFKTAAGSGDATTPTLGTIYEVDSDGVWVTIPDLLSTNVPTAMTSGT